MKGEPPVTLFWVIITFVVVWAWLSLPHIDHPLGSDWGHYFTAAEYIWDPRAGLAYPDFRKPWYGWIIGGLGQWGGYFVAAQFVGRAAMVLMVLGSALLGTAMAGRWAGLVAAVTVPLMPLVMDGALWVNHYPLLGATVGLSVGAGAAAVRWPSLRWVVLAGVMAGVSMALDLRGAITVPMAVVLVGLGGIPLGLRQTALRLAVVGMMIGSVHTHDQSPAVGPFAVDSIAEWIVVVALYSGSTCMGCRGTHAFVTDVSRDLWGALAQCVGWHALGHIL
jgi:hypothetical protein